jgi:DNA-binding LytR/AlgR family response regulator
LPESTRFPRVLIVEDEPLLRRQLCESLRELWPELSEIAEADSGAAAVRLIGAGMPDIAFLDINLPDMSGIDLAALLRDQAHVVFVTAYSEFAVAAFEQHALDYVLKPATTGRLADTVARLRARIAANESARLSLPADVHCALARHSGRPSGGLKWISVGGRSTVQLIAVSDVLCFNADDKYTEVITASGEWIIRKPIRELLDELSEDEFWQIHRGTIVRVDAIERVTRSDLGNLEVHLRGHARSFPVSRGFAQRFRQM